MAKYWCAKSLSRAFLSLIAVSVLVGGCKEDQEILLSCIGSETVEQIEPAPFSQQKVDIRRSFRFFEAQREISEFIVRDEKIELDTPAIRRVWVFQVDNSQEIYRSAGATIHVPTPYAPHTRSNASEVTVNDNLLEVQKTEHLRADSHGWTNRFQLTIDRISGSFESQLMEFSFRENSSSRLLKTTTGTCTRLSERRI